MSTGELRHAEAEPLLETPDGDGAFPRLSN